MSNENGNSARREALLGDRPGSYAIARHVRMSPMKVRRVVDLIRGMDVTEALTALRFAPQDLYVSKAFVDEGVTLRRIRPRAKGSASRILKRGSHITVVVEPRESKEA